MKNVNVNYGFMLANPILAKKRVKYILTKHWLLRHQQNNPGLEHNHWSFPNIKVDILWEKKVYKRSEVQNVKAKEKADEKVRKAITKKIPKENKI